MNIAIANRLVELRRAHGYSQEELAGKLGVSRQAVSKWERAESSPDTDNLIALARLYGGSPWYLIRTHIGHELLPLLTINALAVVGRAVLQESSLAFLGLSDPLARSWGMMIAKAVDFPGIYRTPFWTWWMLPPAAALLLSTLLLRLLVGALEEQQRRIRPCCWK